MNKRILLVEDDELHRTMVAGALVKNGHDVRCAENLREAIDFIGAEDFAVALLDIRLPDGTGFEACRSICRSNTETRVLILTSVADEEMVDNAIRAGAHGYLLKEINGMALIDAIRDIAAGKSILDPAITARVLTLIRSNTPSTRHLINSLSPQESRVLALIAEGKTNKEVAQDLNLAEKTVKNYLSTVFEKLHVTRRTQAAALYAQVQAKENS